MKWFLQNTSSNAIHQFAMLRRSCQVLAVALIAGLGAASAQGTFAQIAYGAGWQTTFVLVNADTTTAASVSLAFYSDSGANLPLPVNGGAAVSPYNVNIPPSGSISVVIKDNGSPTASQGWASLHVTNSVAVSGQAIFRQDLGSPHPVTEAAVPLTGGTPTCIFSFWDVEPTHYLLIPFDNTTNTHVTAIAVANTTASAISAPIAFQDQVGTTIASDTLNLAAMNHTAYVSTDKYPSTAGKTGIIRITLPSGANPGDLAALALLANPNTGTLTTLVPIVQ